MLSSSQVWKPTYFIFELPDLLLLYRSRDDYIYNPKVCCTLSYAAGSSVITFCALVAVLVGLSDEYIRMRMQGTLETQASEVQHDVVAFKQSHKRKLLEICAADHVPCLRSLYNCKLLLPSHYIRAL
jgi:hypothetical protein